MIPKQDAAFIAYARFFTEQIRINQEKWGIRETQFVPLRRANNAAQAAWLKHTDKQTAGNAARIDKDDTFAALREIINLIHDTLRGAFDLVTDNELHHLGVTPRKQKAHEPVVIAIATPTSSSTAPASTNSSPSAKNSNSADSAQNESATNACTPPSSSATATSPSTCRYPSTAKNSTGQPTRPSATQEQKSTPPARPA